MKQRGRGVKVEGGLLEAEALLNFCEALARVGQKGAQTKHDTLA